MTYLLIKTSVAGRINRKVSMTMGEYDFVRPLRNHVSSELVRSAAEHIGKIDPHNLGISTFILTKPSRHPVANFSFTHKGQRRDFTYETPGFFRGGWTEARGGGGSLSRFTGESIYKEDLEDLSNLLERYEKGGYRTHSVGSTANEIYVDFHTRPGYKTALGLTMKRADRGKNWGKFIVTQKTPEEKIPNMEHFTPEDISKMGRHVEQHYPGTNSFLARKQDTQLNNFIEYYSARGYRHEETRTEERASVELNDFLSGHAEFYPDRDALKSEDFENVRKLVEPFHKKGYRVVSLGIQKPNSSANIYEGVMRLTDPTVKAQPTNNRAQIKIYKHPTEGWKISEFKKDPYGYDIMGVSK